MLKEVVIMALHCVPLNFHQSMSQACEYLSTCLTVWMCPPRLESGAGVVCRGTHMPKSSKIARVKCWKGGLP